MASDVVSGNYLTLRHLLDLNKMPEEEVRLFSSLSTNVEITLSNPCVPIGECHTSNSSLDEAILRSSIESGPNSSSSISIVPFRLPDNWKIITVRTEGKIEGRTDKYYVAPNGRKFRSKNEVMNFLETGKKKRKSSPEADVGSSGSPASGKRKRSSVKRKNSSALKTDNVASATCS